MAPQITNEKCLVLLCWKQNWVVKNMAGYRLGLLALSAAEGASWKLSNWGHFWNQRKQNSGRFVEKLELKKAIKAFVKNALSRKRLWVEAIRETCSVLIGISNKKCIKSLRQLLLHDQQNNNWTRCFWLPFGSNKAQHLTCKSTNTGLSSAGIFKFFDAIVIMPL